MASTTKKGNHTPNGKTSISELELRVNEVYKLILKDYSRADILQHISKLDWGVSDRTIDNYIHRANEILKRKSNTNQCIWLARVRSRLENLYKKNYELGRYDECRRILETANKLYGFDKMVIDHNVKGEVEHKHTLQIDDDVKNRVLDKISNRISQDNNTDNKE